MDNYIYYPNCAFGFQSTFDRSDGEPFETGIYNYSLDGTTFYILHYYNVDINKFLILARPRLITNDAGKVTNIIINYASTNSQNVDAPAFIINLWVELQRKDDMGECIVEGTNPDNQILDYTNVVISKDIHIDEVALVTFSYTAIIGNEYNIRWSFQN